MLWLRRDRIRWRRMVVTIAVFGTGAGVALWAAFPVFARTAWLRVSTAFEFFSVSPNTYTGNIDLGDGTGNSFAGWFSFQPMFEKIVREEPDLLD